MFCVFPKEKKDIFILSQFCHLGKLVFDQSSPIPPFQNQGGSSELADRGGRSKTFLCLILDLTRPFRALESIPTKSYNYYNYISIYTISYGRGKSGVSTNLV